MYHTIVFQFSSDELIRIFSSLKDKSDMDIQVLKDKINKFERKRRVEEAYYQSLSSFRKIFTGRPPAHHQAVEYLVNVKERFHEIEVIKQKIAILDQIISQVQINPQKEELKLSHVMFEEIRNWKGKEGILYDAGDH